MFNHHILLISFPGQGHINPALQFAKRLIAMGAHVTLAITLYMHRSITNSNQSTIHGLSFAVFSDGYDGGFRDVSFRLYVSELKRHGSEYLTNLIASNAQEGHPFTCLVYTMLLPWAAKVAREFHLPVTMLWTQPAAVFRIYDYYFHDHGNIIDNIIIKEPSRSIELPGLPLLLTRRDIPLFTLGSNVYSLVVPMMEEQFQELELETNPRILVNTFEALEPEALRAVDKFNMIPIGPLLPSAFLDGKDPNDTSFGGDIFRASNGYLEWLDSKPEFSVVYVSFGSISMLSKRQMEEIARALLDFGHPFLWVVTGNGKRGNEGREEGEDELSCGEELEQMGKIVKWCSQVEVLSHRSLGCFVTHCGWNSTIESLVSGVPVVAFPQWTDQKTNAKLIEDVWKTGVRVDEVNEEGIVPGKEIRRGLEVVMGSAKKAEEFRRNAKKWKSLAREAMKEGGSSDKNLRTFLDDVGKCLGMAEN